MRIASSLAALRPDSIEQTLVTVDVTGTWVGSMGKGPGVVEVRLELA